MFDFGSIIVYLCSELVNGGVFVNFFFGEGGVSFDHCVISVDRLVVYELKMGDLFFRCRLC